jgi:hypothetical protein
VMGILFHYREKRSPAVSARGKHQGLGRVTNF